MTTAHVTIAEDTMMTMSAGDTGVRGTLPAASGSSSLLDSILTIGMITVTGTMTGMTTATGDGEEEEDGIKEQGPGSSLRINLLR